MPQPIPLADLFASPAPRPSPRPSPSVIPLASLFGPSPAPAANPLDNLFAPPSPSPLAPPVGPDVVDVPGEEEGILARVTRALRSLPPGYLPSAFDSTPAPTVAPLQGTEALGAAYRGIQGAISLPAQAVDDASQRVTGRPAGDVLGEAMGRAAGASPERLQEGVRATERVAAAHPGVPGLGIAARAAGVGAAMTDEATKVAGKLGADPATYLLPASKALQAFFVPGMVESAGEEFAQARALYEAAGNKVTPEVARAVVRAVASTAFAAGGALHMARESVGGPVTRESVAAAVERARATPERPVAERVPAALTEEQPKEAPPAPEPPAPPAPEPEGGWPSTVTEDKTPRIMAGDVDVTLPLDRMPKELHPVAKEVISDLAALTADKMQFKEETLDAILSARPELVPHRAAIREQIIEDGVAIRMGRQFLETLRESYKADPKQPDGIVVRDTSFLHGEPSKNVLQYHDGKVVGGAYIENGELGMIAGGRALGSPVSIRPVYEWLDANGIRRNNVLTSLGKRGRRTFEESKDAAPVGGIPSSATSRPGEPGPRPGVEAEAGGTGGEVPPAAETGGGSGAPPSGPPATGGVGPGEPGTPGEPPTPARQIAQTSRLGRGYSAVRNAIRDYSTGLRPSLDVVGDIKGSDGTAGSKIKAMSEGYLRDWEVPASRDRGDFEGAIRNLTKAEQQDVIRVLDEGAAPSSPRVASAAKQTRAILDRVAGDARAADVFVGYRENYFPHRWAGEGFDFDVIARKLADEKFGGDITRATAELNRMVQFGERRNPNLERERSGSAPDYERSFDVIRDYIVEARERIALAKHFGPKMERVQAVIDTIPPSRVGTMFPRSYAQTFVRRLTGREPVSFGADIGTKIRTAQAVTKLGLASITQLNQIAPLVAREGLAAPVRGLARAITDFEGAKIDATRSGSLWPNILGEVTKSVGGDRGGFAWGVGKADKFMRVVSDASSRAYFDNLVKRGRWAELESLGVTRELVESNRAEAQMRVAKALTDVTQTRTGTEHLPLWATSPAGRVVMQFRNFAYGFTTQFLLPTMARAAKGDPQAMRTLMVLVIAGAGAGKATSEAKRKIREEFTRAMGGTPRERSQRSELLMDRYGDLAASGAVGLIDLIVQAARSKNAAAALGGPTVGEVDAFNRRVWPSIAAGDYEKAGRSGAKLGLEQHFPIFGRQLGDYFFPREER